jgi:predicted ABC-type ATPase
MQQKQPNAFIFAGANASGKSTFITHLLSNNIIFGEFVNPDIILKEELKLEENPENYKKAFDIGEERRNTLLKNKKDIIVETVFSTQNKIDYIYKLIENDYHVTVFFTGTDDPKINAMYLIDRVSNGGHDVPIKKLIDRRLRGFINIKKISQDIDCLIFVDNSIYDESPTIIKSMYKNNICFVNDCDRESEWLSNVIDESQITVLEDLSIVPIEHLQLCENIQNASNTFVSTLSRTYDEKNKILNESKNRN